MPPSPIFVLYVETATSEESFVDASFADVYAQYVEDIYRFTLRLLGNPAEAEDMTAETFLRAYQSWSQLLQPERVRPWLFQIAYHLCVDVMRREGRRATISLDDTTATEMMGVLTTWTSNTPLPVDGLMRQEVADFLQNALLGLRPIDRVVLVLGELEGVPNQEIARTIQRSVTAVKSVRQRARKALREEVLRLLKRQGTTIEEFFFDV